MAQPFKDIKILIVNSADSSRKMLLGVLKIQGVGHIDQAYEATDAYRKFTEHNHDMVFAALENGVNDAIGVAKKIRNEASSPNAIAPIIAIGGPKTLNLMDAAREVGITDLLQAPFTVDDVSKRIRFVLSLKQEQLEVAAEAQEAPQINATQGTQEEWPPEEEAQSMTDTLLDHYIKHHEVVLSKLKFAKEGTTKSIDEIRAMREKMKDLDNTNIHTFSDFDKMWEEIIGMFVRGGLSEEELFKIEKVISTVPDEIKKHYDTLSQQDKSFLAMMNSLNTSAYRKAKSRARDLQANPNPLNGRTAADYAVHVKEQKEEDANSWQETELPSGDAMMFMPTRPNKK